MAYNEAFCLWWRDWWAFFFPALALIECLLEKSLNSVFVGSERGIEYKLKDKIPTESLFVPAHPFMGRSVKDKLLAILKSFKGAYRVAKLINQCQEGSKRQAMDLESLFAQSIYQ